MSKNIGRIPGRFTDSVLKTLFIEIQRIFDNLSGVWLKEGSVAYSKLSIADGEIPPDKVGDLPVNKIIWPQWFIPLILPAQDYTTTDTVGAAVGGYFNWDPAAYPTSGGSWYLEGSIAISDAAGTATLELHGSASVGSVTTTSTALSLVRGTALTMPGSAQNLYCKMKTSNASYTATLAGARLVFVPS